MHYYQFNISDYIAETFHLDNLEDLAFRRLLDLYYSKEKPLENDMEKLAKKCRMQSECERIANVLHEFFTLEDDGFWHNDRADFEIFKYQGKSEKATKSAKIRWKKHKEKQRLKEGNANAEQTHNEGNANQNQEPEPRTRTNKKNKRFTPPSIEDVKKYCDERNNNVNPNDFINHYETTNWMRGKNKIKDWKACVRTWESKNKVTNLNSAQVARDWANES